MGFPLRSFVTWYAGDGPLMQLPGTLLTFPQMLNTYVELIVSASSESIQL